MKGVYLLLVVYLAAFCSPAAQVSPTLCISDLNRYYWLLCALADRIVFNVEQNCTSNFCRFAFDPNALVNLSL